MNADNIFLLLGGVVAAVMAVLYLADHIWHIVTDGRKARVEPKINYVKAPRTYNSYQKGHN